MGFFSGHITTQGSYEPSTLFKLLKPKKSGNEINGLGEEKARNPIPLLWHKPSRIRYKYIQMLFKLNFRPRIIVFHTKILKKYVSIKVRKYKLRKSTPIVAPKKETPEAFATLLKKVADKNNVNAFGITKLKKEWIFKGYELPKWATKAMTKNELFLVVFAVQHSPEAFNKAPHWDFSKEIANQYNNGSDIAVNIANYILEQGYHAYGHGGPEAGEFLLTPAAIDAGIGELGKHGSLINPKLGGNFRLGAVYTTMPLQTNSPTVVGIDDFCQKCQVCTKACPPKAISDSKKMVRGVKKFYVDFEKCMPYMTDNFGCGICLKVCPWGKETVANRLMEKYNKRMSKTKS